MSESKLSALGYLMDRLALSTAAFSRRLHVDASLVSKWRSGSRTLTAKSIYFSEVTALLLEQDRNTLIDALRPLAPLEEMQSPEQLPDLLFRLLTDRSFTVPKAYSVLSDALCTAEISLYTKGIGRRQAISALLDVAETMDTPGTLLLVDSEQCAWLLEDKDYAKQFLLRVLSLLDRGFHASIALHFSISQEKFAYFFRLFNPIIFHRNTSWFYHQYYDENIYWFSFFILEHTMSVMGMSMAAEQSFTTVFTDAYSILEHKNVVDMVINSCLPMFTEIPPGRGVDVARAVHNKGRPGEVIFSFLPAPAFIAAGPELFDSILRENGVAGAPARRCREANGLLREVSERQLATPNGSVIQILQLEEMRRRAKEGFVSTSLSLLSGQRVTISPAQYAAGLRRLARRLLEQPNFYLLLATKDDLIHLPLMNCWCRGTTWLVQMDDTGFRLCEEPTLVGAALVALEQGWRRVPPGRKDREEVIDMLTSLALELET